MVIIGYRGHAYVVCDILTTCNVFIDGYCEKEEKQHNPFHLTYFGDEEDEAVQQKIRSKLMFIAIGNSAIRRRIFEKFKKAGFVFIHLAHPNAHISKYTKIGENVLIASHYSIHPEVVIGNGAICNTGSIIEHECKIGDFSQVAPGAVLCGNVTIGENTLIGANATVSPNVTIGKNVLIYPGAWVREDVPDNSKITNEPVKWRT